MEEKRELVVRVADEDMNRLERENYEYTCYLDSLAYVLDRHILDDNADVLDSPVVKGYLKDAQEALKRLEDVKKELIAKYVGVGVTVINYNFDFFDKELRYLA